MELNGLYKTAAIWTFKHLTVWKKMELNFVFLA